MSVGGILGESWGLYTKFFTRFFVLGLIVYLIVNLINAIVATLALRAAGYEARNYAGSWHEWSRHDELPLER